MSNKPFPQARRFFCLFELELYNDWPVADVRSATKRMLRTELGPRVKDIDLIALDEPPRKEKSR